MKKTPMFQNHPERLEKGYNSSWKIRSIREMRKLSIEEVSKLTNIKIDRINQAEEDNLILTNDEMEKLASALNTHPGIITFPTWDHIEYKSVRVDLDGEVYINNILYSKSLKGYVSKRDSLSLSFGKRKSISLFTKGNIPSARVSNTKFEIKGDSLGSFNDVYQAGPDFDGDSRTVKKVIIEINLFKNGILYNIDGTAYECGNVSKNRPEDSPTGDWHFNIRFLIKPNQIRDFFGIYQSAADMIIESMSELTPWQGTF